jgi:beta-lactamase class A
MIMKKLRKFITYGFLCLTLSGTAQSTDFNSGLNAYINDKNAVIGLAYYDFQTGQNFSLNDKHKFPMQSVYKIHLALAVLKEVDKGNLSLDQKIFVSDTDLLPETWSPLRDAFPGGNIEISLSILIKYAVAESDNNACDILFRLVGGPHRVNKFIRKSRIKGISIVSTEEQMHASWEEQFKNHSTPNATLLVLKKFYEGKLLKNQSFNFLWETMAETSTGKNRIKGLLPEDVIVAHKTGTGNIGPDGRISAVNDIGIIKTKDGNALAIVIFITMSDLSYEENEKIIAELSHMIFSNFLGNDRQKK